MGSHHSILQQVLCLLLCLSAWRGPVPMIHHHDALTDPVLLERHEEKFHADFCACNEHQCFGIHWHLGSAKELTGKTLFPEDQLPIDTAAFASLHVSLTHHAESHVMAHSLNVVCDVWSTEDLRTQHARRPALDARQGFLMSMLSTSPLVCVTGVCIV